METEEEPKYACEFAARNARIEKTTAIHTGVRSIVTPFSNQTILPKI